jgi:Mce-associated membrane protein
MSEVQPAQTEEQPQQVPEGVPPRRDRLLLGLVAVALLLLVAVGVLGWQVQQSRDVEEARETARAAAQNAVVAVLSYDHRTMADDVAEAERLSTGAFLEQYRSATTGLSEQAEAGQVVVTARVVHASVQDVTDGRVAVLLFVDQTTDRADLEEPRVEQSRVRLTMQREDGRWLVAELESL